MKLFVLGYIDEDSTVHAWSPCGEPYVPSDPTCSSIMVLDSTLTERQVTTGVSIATSVEDGVVMQSETVNCEIETFYILDEISNILTDENNNRLTY